MCDQVLLPEFRGLPPVPEDQRPELRAVPVLQEGLQEHVSPLVGGEVGDPAGREQVSRQNLKIVEKFRGNSYASL